MHTLLAVCVVLVKYAPKPEFGLLAVEPTIMMQSPKCAAEVWLNPNPGFGQHAVEEVVMMLYPSK